MTGGYRYLDGVAMADVALEAWGATAEEMFAEAADAMMNCMVEDLASIRPVVAVPVEVENAVLDMLLYAVLQELVYLKDARQLLLRLSSATISRRGDMLLFRGRAEGERIDFGRHHLAVDVKAVTLHLLRAEQTAEGWRATVVLDI